MPSDDLSVSSGSGKIRIQEKGLAQRARKGSEAASYPAVGSLLARVLKTCLFRLRGTSYSF